MATYLVLRYEAQLAKSGFAKCKICGEPVGKGTHVIKVLGQMTNESIHPECIGALTLSLRDVINEFKDNREYCIRAIKGFLKIGFYQATEDPKKKFFVTLKSICLATGIETVPEKKEEEKPNVPKP